ncbi:MAG: hypothetical protein ACI4WH_00180 [Oscillospiraceae bacterium]
MYIDEQVQGTIYFVDNSEPFSFNSNAIIDDDISILQQATADDSFSIGGTYSSTLNMTIRIPNGYTNSYDIIGSRIVLKSKYGSEENYIMRGVFWITSADRYKDIYTISGSDAIIWLDTIPYLTEPYIDNNNVECNNLVYAYMIGDIGTLNYKLSRIAEAVNKYLQDNNVNIQNINVYENNIKNNNPPVSDGYKETGYCVLPNDITGENATHCPRDYAGWLSQIACGFLECIYFEDSETPYISIGQFETAPTDTLKWQNFEENTLEIANFSINCCQVYVEIYNGTLGSTMIENKNINSFIVDLTGNPFVDGYWTYRENAEGDHSCMDILENILDFAKNLAIRPFSGTFLGEKRFKLGQCIKLMDENGKSYNTILTKIQWNFRGGYELKCAGKDNRMLFDSARRTPSVRAKEQALTKTNYAIKKTETGLQSNIDYIDEKFSQQFEGIEGDNIDLNNAISTLWNYVYGDIEDRLKETENFLYSIKNNKKNTETLRNALLTNFGIDLSDVWIDA